MKKELLTGILMLMLVVFGGTNVSAKEIKAGYHSVGLAPAAENDEEEISATAIKAFRKMFSFASNENWYKVSDGYIVKFVYEGIQYRAGYDAKGRWINTVKSYDATKLPADVKYRVKSTYFDFAIVFVEEINLPYEIGYVIHLENDAAIKKLIVTDMDSDIQVLEAYQKK